MKKSLWIALVIVMAVLFVPIPTGVYKDGGTRSYTALTYRIVRWKHMLAGSEAELYQKTRIYPFPMNLMSLDALWERERALLPETGLSQENETARTTVLLGGRIPPNWQKAEVDGLELYIPEGWEYGLQEQGRVGIRFWPAGETGGVVAVEHYPGHFGVCGTGLSQREVTVGGYPAYEGVYDKKRAWSFISLHETPGEGSYVVHNEGADWLASRNDEVMAILNTLRIKEE